MGFFCATKDQSETRERVEDARWSVRVDPFAPLDSVQNTYRLLNKWTAYTNMKTDRGTIQSIYCMMRMNRTNVFVLMQTFRKVAPGSVWSHSPVFVPGLVDCGAGQRTA